MSAETQDPKAKLADLLMTLQADSGYSASVETRISAQQWHDINHIVNGTKTEAERQRDELLAAAKQALDECVDLISTPAGDALTVAIAKAEGRPHERPA